MKRMLIFWEMRDSSMSFTPNLPKPSHHTIHKVQFSGTQLTLPHTMGNNTIFLIPKGMTPFTRTIPSWKRAFPGTPGMHMIELMVHNQKTHHKHTKFT